MQAIFIQLGKMIPWATDLYLFVQSLLHRRTLFGKINIVNKEQGEMITFTKIFFYAKLPVLF